MSLRHKACWVHIFISLCVAGVAAAIVFLVWYPYPYRELSGGRELFLLLVSVDVMLGPLLTFVVFNPKKTFRELQIDLAVVVILQAAGLGYGLWAMAQARPVHLVFEIDRFRVVHAIEVPNELLEKLPREKVTLPWMGPTILSIRNFRNTQESSEMTLAALQGLSLAFRPELWQSYEESIDDVKRSGKPLSWIKEKFPEHRELLTQVIKASGYPPERLAALPLVARAVFWTILINADTGEIVVMLPIDTFE